jgi:hypothetical protein
VTRTRKRIIGNRKRKATGKQLITYFLSTLEAPSIGHGRTSRQIPTIILKIKKLPTCKPKQDSDTKPRRRQPKERDKRTKYETNKKMDKEDGIMEDHSKHPCQQQRREHERMKHRIKQTITAFLTTIIVTFYFTQHRKQEHGCTGTRNKNTKTGTVHTQHKQVNRDRKEDSRSMDNERYATGRTRQTSSKDQHEQSKARDKLDRTINRYKELNTRTYSRPKQHKHYIKGKLMTAIAIIIMIIATASAAANDIVTTTYETYNKEQQRSKEDMVNRIKTATTTEPQNTTQEAYATHAKPGTRTKKHDKTGSKGNAKHDTGKEQRQICVIALLTENYRQAKEHCWKVQQTRKMATTRQAQGQGRTRGTKSRA